MVVFRVSLQQLTGSQLVAVSPRDLEDGSRGREEEEIPLVTLANSAPPPAESSSSYTQHSVIKWQQKILRFCTVFAFTLHYFGHILYYMIFLTCSIKISYRYTCILQSLTHLGRVGNLKQVLL